MTSYTRKLYRKHPSLAMHMHRKPQRLAMLISDATEPFGVLTFATGDQQDAEIDAEFRTNRRQPHIEPEFEVAERLQRWADRGWK